MKEPKIDLELAQQHGLSNEEFDRIIEILGRKPNYTELGVYSVMWSEHCSYKSSIKYLKTLPKEGKKVLAGAGEENAGALDIGNDLAVVFKIESHNHPSAIEPFQGAATGVGGILRDVFSMGARPIAALDSLRFGEIHNPHQQHLLNGVVEGIAHYGNCFGVPTVGGEVVFDKAYGGNCLVNAMAVGISPSDKIMSAKAGGIGNPVFIIGASTGRDGIHGATFASVELSEDSRQDRPSVQIGDPFLEKSLMEATLEIIEQDLAYGIQDMGAAGITCSSSEMAAAGNVGIEIDLDKVPLREEGMIPYEILLSESQERMLIVGNSGKENELRAVAQKWDLHMEKIGEVTEGENFVCWWKGEKVCDIPAETLVLGGGAPVYDRPFKKPASLEKINDWSYRDLPLKNRDPQEMLTSLLSMPTLASKRWVFTQYDHQVGINTVVKPGYDAALMRIKGTDSFIALSTDCNGRYCYLDPYNGTLHALVESARNVIATGAEPIGITNCLNFGNPEKEDSYWYFVEAIKGLKDACEYFNLPVTGGNVSFYNESPTGSVYPTPVIGMVGLIEDGGKYITQQMHEGELIYLLGETRIEDFGGSALQKLLENDCRGKCPKVDLEKEYLAYQAIKKLNNKGIIASCHDISDGGLGIALAESCIWSNSGVDIQLPQDFDSTLFFFSESQGRYLITIAEKDRESMEEILNESKLVYHNIGEVYGDKMTINQLNISIQINTLKSLYNNSLSRYMTGEI